MRREEPLWKSEQQLLSKSHEKKQENVMNIRKATVSRFFKAPVRKLKARIQSAFYKNLKAMNLEGTQDRSSNFVKRKVFG